MTDQFVVQVLQGTVFNIDAKSDTHPMNQDVGSPEEIKKHFDSISYRKGKVKFIEAKYI